MAKKRKKKRNAQPTGRNRHHLLFIGRCWNVGMAKELRAYFVYYIPVGVHNELHNHRLHNVPKPPPEALKPLYLAFLAQKGELDRLDIIEALEWLQSSCAYLPFKQAIQTQLDFFREKLG